MPARTQWAAAPAARPGGCYRLATRKNRVSWRITRHRSYGSYKTYRADESHFSADTQRIHWRSSEKSLRVPGIIRRGGVAGREKLPAHPPPRSSTVNCQMSIVNCQLSKSPGRFVRRVESGRCDVPAAPARRAGFSWTKYRSTCACKPSRSRSASMDFINCLRALRDCLGILSLPLRIGLVQSSRGLTEPPYKPCWFDCQ